MGAKFSAPVQTDPGAHPASCKMGTGSFPGIESGQDVTLTPHPLLVPRYKKQSRDMPLLSLRTFVACKKLRPTYILVNSRKENIASLICFIFTFLFMNSI
jgi:hypothetical protein